MPPAKTKIPKRTISPNFKMPPTVVNNSVSMELSQMPSQALSFEPMENLPKSTDISASNALETSHSLHFVKIHMVLQWQVVQ